jgi:hypothetical protein
MLNLFNESQALESVEQEFSEGGFVVAVVAVLATLSGDTDSNE